jgi:hypothetical protein
MLVNRLWLRDSEEFSASFGILPKSNHRYSMTLPERGPIGPGMSFLP